MLHLLEDHYEQPALENQFQDYNHHDRESVIYCQNDWLAGALRLHLPCQPYNFWRRGDDSMSQVNSGVSASEELTGGLPLARSPPPLAAASYVRSRPPALAPRQAGSQQVCPVTSDAVFGLGTRWVRLGSI